MGDVVEEEAWMSFDEFYNHFYVRGGLSRQEVLQKWHEAPKELLDNASGEKVLVAKVSRGGKSNGE